MKTVFIAGVESQGSGSWDWFPTAEPADNTFESDKRVFKDLDNQCHAIYRGDLVVPADLDGDDLTQYIENYLAENDFQNAPLLNKKMHVIIPAE